MTSLSTAADKEEADDVGGDRADLEMRLQPMADGPVEERPEEDGAEPLEQFEQLSGDALRAAADQSDPEQ